MLAGSMKNCLSESRPCPTRAYYSLRARGERVDVAIKKKRERERKCVETNPNENKKRERKRGRDEGTGEEEGGRGREGRGARFLLLAPAESFHRACNILTAYSTGLPTS